MLPPLRVSLAGLTGDDVTRRARQVRDDYIRRLVSEGVTAYRISQTIRISQSALAKIIRPKGERP